MMSDKVDISMYLSKSKQGTMQPIDFLTCIILSLYLLIDCVSLSSIQDQLGIHWLLMGGLNFISGIFLFKNRKEILNYSTNILFRNSITILYFSFFIIAGISFFSAFNKVESMIIYTRLLTTILTFSTIAILINKRLYLLKKIAVVIAIVVLIKSYLALSMFYGNVGKVGLDALISSLQSSDGNKNIFAAVLIVQIPLIIYGFFVHEKWLKYLCGISLGFAFMVVFIINARSAYLGLILQLLLLLIGFVYLFYKEGNLKVLYKNAGIILVILFGAFFISQNSINKAIQKDKNSVYGTFGDRLSTITDNSNSATSIRLDYWKQASNVVVTNPILGVGIGNWKLYTTTYTNTLLDDNVFSKHPHNDFIEIAGETGIPNSVIYLLIFVFAFVLTIKSLFSKRDHDTKLISLILFVSLCGYFVDAFFNFPLERPHMQILFAFVLASFIANYVSDIKIERETTPAKVSILVLILASIFTIGIHFIVFKSMKSQFVIDRDLNSVDNLPDAIPQYKYAQVKTMFPSFPNIAENSETIGLKEAKYLRKEKKYEEAIKILDSVHKFSPYIVYDYYLKCNIYMEQKKMDSAYVYGKKAFYAKPRNFYYYRMASYLASTTKDTTEIVKMFNVYNTYRKEQQSYSYYAQCLGWSDYDVNKLKNIVDEGLKLYPKDPELLNLKSYLGK